MVIEQIKGFIISYPTEIILSLTFCAICWYSYETRRLVQLNTKIFLIREYRKIFNYNIEKQQDDDTNMYIAKLPEKIRRLFEEVEEMQ